MCAILRWPRTARLTRHLTFNCSAGSLITCTFSRAQPRSRCILYMQRNILMPLLRKFVPFRPIKRLLLSVLYMIIRRESPETSRNDEKEWSRDVPQQPISTRRRRVCLVCGASTWLEIVFQRERMICIYMLHWNNNGPCRESICTLCTLDQISISHAGKGMSGLTYV